MTVRGYKGKEYREKRSKLQYRLGKTNLAQSKQKRKYRNAQYAPAYILNFMRRFNEK